MTDRRRTRSGTGSPCANAVLEALESRQLLTAELLKDVNDVGGDSAGGPFVEYNEQLYFFPRVGTLGPELWRSGGTPDTTALVKEIVPGPSGVTPRDVGVLNGLLFFVNDNGRSLWRSDGTEAGTFSLAPARAASAALAPVGGPLLFVNADGNELWTSDGTPAGTVRLQSFGAPSPTVPRLGGFTLLNGEAFFWARDDSGARLWRTNGTPSGTRLADDARSWSSFGSTVAVGDRLYFVANFDELWSHDPATGQSRLVDDEMVSFASNLTAVGDMLYFTATDFDNGTELWRSDGGATGTHPVADIVPGFDSSGPAQLTAFDGKLYFAAHDADGTYGLWSADPARQSEVTLVKPFVESSGRAIVETIRAIGDRLYVGVHNEVLGGSLWISDGTNVGTTKILQTGPGGVGTPVEAGGVVFFGANDGVHGHELWRTDGTAAGTALVTDLGGGTPWSAPTRLFEANGSWYFGAQHGAYGYGLWRTDGTPSGTIHLKSPIHDAKYLGQIAQTVFFSATTDEHGTELWRTDGTPAGTRLVRDIVPGFEGSRIEHGAVLDGTLYFGARVGGKYEVWKSDGTQAGTVKAMDVNSQLFDLASDGERLLLAYFPTLFASDGTTAGTTPLTGTGSGRAFDNAKQLTPTDKGTFLTGENSAGTMIWLTDGTPAGTRAIGSGYTDAVILDYVDGILYFAADDGVHGLELWRTDGTDAGTFMLVDAKAGPDGQFIRDNFIEPWIDYGDLLLVQLTNANNERQLWRSDGTAAGTYVLPLPGTTRMWHFDPPMAVVGGLAYVADAAPGDLVGRMWSTDGTIDGTNIVSWEPFDDELTNPGEFMSVNGDLVFAATHPVIGRELYTLDVPHVITITGTAGDDHWVLRDHTNGFIGLWSNNKPTTEPPDFRWDPVDIAALRFEGLGGNDTLVIGGYTYFPVHFDGGDGDADRVAASGPTHPLRGNFEHADVSQAADLLLAGDLALQCLLISGGGRVTLTDGDAPITLRTKTLEIATAAGSALDLSDNTLIIDGADAATIDALLASARNAPAGRWKGPGITSLTAANGSPLTGLAATQVDNDVIVKYTYNGDANGDGRINADDYFRIDQAFLAQPADPLFSQGDFNFDDAINADDYFLIDQSFLGQGAPVGVAADAADGASASDVPAPASVAAADETTTRATSKRVRRHRSPLRDLLR